MSEKSFLFVPGNRPERFDKACGTGADAVILDLEDAVAPAGKEAAREVVRRWLQEGGRAWLRVNGTDTPWHRGDLALLDLEGVLGVLLPKAERPDELQALATRTRGDTPLMPLVETAVGLWNARELASVAGVQRLAFGSVDFQVDLSIQGDGEELLFARSQLVLASRVAGVLPPVDGVTVAIDDDAVLQADVARARRLGFGAKLCIHPRQVRPIQAGFRPPAADIEWARCVIEAADAAGHDAVRLDGKLVDKPVIDRARALLQASAA
ncbi:MAG TPA: CoA ester lyase [Thauera sp.]|nr:CoA ester lyase [Thauera sp.]